MLFPEPQPRRGISQDIAKVGVSHATYESAKKIITNGSEEKKIL
ncbi:MAG: hypothetical protein WAM14_15795 [Candidatus Nitrosopolaris sp.]